MTALEQDDFWNTATQIVGLFDTFTQKQATLEQQLLQSKSSTTNVQTRLEQVQEEQKQLQRIFSMQQYKALLSTIYVHFRAFVASPESVPKQLDVLRLEISDSLQPNFPNTANKLELPICVQSSDEKEKEETPFWSQYTDPKSGAMYTIGPTKVSQQTKDGLVTSRSYHLVLVSGCSNKMIQAIEEVVTRHPNRFKTTVVKTWADLVELFSTKS